MGDEDAEMSDSEEEEIEELIEEFEYRLSREQRKRELQAELNRRIAAMRRFKESLDENWEEVMAPVPVSDSEDELEVNDSKKNRSTRKVLHSCYTNGPRTDRNIRRKRFNYASS